jgi:hypothetical protein
LKHSSTFLCECYRQGLISSPLVVQILIPLLSDGRFLSLAIELLWDVAPILHIDDKVSLTFIFENLFKYSDDPAISPEIRRLTLWRQRNWVKEKNGKKIFYHRVSKSFDLVEESDQISHDTFDLDEISEETDPTAAFSVPHRLDQFATMRLEYKEFLNGLFSGEEEAADEPPPAVPIDLSEIKDTAAAVDANVAKNEELQIKRKVYLTIVSNVTSNATAHVLLKMADELGEKYWRVILNMCVDFTGMEKTYNRDLGVLLELLCRAQPVFVEMIETTFVKNYSDCFKFTAHRITNLGSLYAYLFSKDIIDWRILCVIRLTEADTNSAQRVFLRILMEELAQNLSFEGIVRKFAEPEVSESIKELFPTDSLENAEFASAYFHEIQLGFLCENLDREIERMEQEAEEQKRKELDMIAALQKSSRLGSRDQGHHHRHHRHKHRVSDSDYGD